MNKDSLNKSFIIAFLFFSSPLAGINCQMDNSEQIKDTSPIIIKDASFIHVYLSVTTYSDQEIKANLILTNKGNDSILIYKSLLPCKGEVQTKIFSIFCLDNYESVPFLGVTSEKLLFVSADDEEGVIIPKLFPENFINFKSGDSLKFETNLAKYYKFGSSLLVDNKDFAATFSILLPVVSYDYKQVLELDTLEGKQKPLYYHITLPRSSDIDSMRVYFKV